MVREEDLAAAVREWLELEGWTTYAEVSYEGRIADIVATRGPSTWIVEAKASRSAVVIAQAAAWRGEAHKVSVAVPRTSRRPDPLTWDRQLNRYGLGEFTVGTDGMVELTRSPIHPVPLQDLGIRSVLKEEHRDFAKAGNAEGKRYTPFQQTLRTFKGVANDFPGITLKQYAEHYPHHYATPEAAVAGLRSAFRQGAVKGFELRHGGKVYPEGFDRHSVSRSE